MEICVEVSFTAYVKLPEGCERLTAAAQQRAVEAITSAIPENMKVYLDGEGKDPVEVYCDCGELEVGEVWCE